MEPRLSTLDLVRGGRVDLGGLTALLARRFGRRACLDLRGRVLNYRDVDDEVARLASAHVARGHAFGARVGVAVGNKIDLALHLLALVRAGAVPMPLAPRLVPDEVRAIAVEAGLVSLIADDERAVSLAGILAGIAPRLVRASQLSAWLAQDPGARLAPERRQRAGAVAALLSTSGTTGTPKIVALTSDNLLAFPRLLAALPLGKRSILSALPLTHIAGLEALLAALCVGARYFHVERFRADDVLDRIERDRPEAFAGVPTMYADLEDAGAAAHDLSSVMLFLSGADAMPAARARRFQRLGALAPGLSAAFADVYGLVESSGPAAVRVYAPLAVGAALPPAGFLLPHVEGRVVDEEGRPVPRRAAGVLQLRGKSVVSRYDTAGAPVDDDGWFTTGDVVRLWGGRVFSWVGRGRERIKVGGFSVFPADVERALRGHPRVADVAVAAVQDERLGEVPVALVVPKGPIDVDALARWAGERLSSHRRPRRFVVVDRLPRTAAGKLDRDAAARIAEASVQATRPSSSASKYA